MSRVVTGVILIPLVLLVVLRGSTALLLIGLLAIAVPACVELGRLLAARGRRPLTAAATAAAWGLIAGFALEDPLPLAGAGLAVLAASIVAMVARREPAEAADAFLSTALCAIWIGVGLGAMLGLRVAGGDDEQGRMLLLLCLLVTWASDTAAFYGGRSLGRHRLGWVSPGKTWEGIVFGLGAGLLVSAILTPWVPGLDLGHALGLGGCVTVAGMIGDLAESLQKRAAGMKDSGGLLPGHGGVLDRMDSLLMAAPAAMVYAHYALWW